MSTIRFKILDLYLEGFAKIHTGMHIDRLYLDFNNAPNKIFLLVGDSGSGKSSILKSIHPFAFNSATGDESGSSDLIMSKRNGRKIIRYLLDGKEIKCSHFYIRKPDDGIQVKSYFSVDGEELNPSGLVTTFKELVQKYFYIDESFLTLLALGNSVKSMVEFTASERKKLAVKIFSELNIYMSYYKNASTVVRDLKTVLSNVIDKLGKYGSYDKDEIKAQIKSLKTTISQLEAQLDEVLKNEGSIKKDIEHNQEAFDAYSSCESLITELFSKIEKLKSKRKTSSDVINLENQLNELTKALISTQLRIESLESNIKSELDFKEIKLGTKRNLEDSIQRMENNTNQTELEKLLANISAELVSLSEIDVDLSIDYTEKKDKLIRANIYLDELREMCTDLITEVRNKKLIAEVLANFLKSNRSRYESELDISYKAIVERIETMESTSKLSGRIRIPKVRSTEVSCDNPNDCPYKKFYQICIEIITQDKDKADHMFRVENDKLNDAEDRKTIFSILSKLYAYIEKHQDCLADLPKKIFDPNTFVSKYIESSDRLIYNTELISSTISYLEQAVRKVYLLTLEDTTKKQLAGLATTISLYESMKVDLERIELTLSETDSTITHYQTDLEYNKSQLDKINSSIKELKSEIELAKELESYRNQIKEVQRQLNSMEDCRQRFNTLTSELKDIQDKVGSIRSELTTYRSQLSSSEHILETINSLEKEKEMLMTRYSEAILIRDAVSPSKGIPVEFINNVIRNQMIDAINELMHIAYPDITLIKDPDKLIINDKEFMIPYKKNGIIIGDISEASDGERAMLSLAFSLVLIRLVSKVYNIMLLDEMDTALDKYGRSKYIDIIEKYMKTISASQIFLISHNSMFDMYDVNVLQTTESVGTMENRYVVKVYEQNITLEKI